MRSNILDAEKIPAEWVLVAQLDESADYEVDMSEIFYDKKKKEYLLITATGCSCWSGEYESETYKKLKDIEKKLFVRDDKGYVYNPSVQGAHDLIEQANKNLKKI